MNSFISKIPSSLRCIKTIQFCEQTLSLVFLNSDIGQKLICCFYLSSDFKYHSSVISILCLQYTSSVSKLTIHMKNGKCEYISSSLMIGLIRRSSVASMQFSWNKALLFYSENIFFTFVTVLDFSEDLPLNDFFVLLPDWSERLFFPFPLPPPACGGGGGGGGQAPPLPA